MNDVNFVLPPNAIVGIIGPNGAGKTTLFRMITGHDQPDAGLIKLGDSVKLAYVEQSRDDLKPDDTVWQAISDGAEFIKLGNVNVNSRGYVTRFTFVGADQQRKVGTLSGGERNRVHLARMMKMGANVLLLDEPTNDFRCQCDSCIRRSAGELCRLRRGDQPRPLVSRSARDAHPRVRGRQPSRLPRWQLQQLRSRPKETDGPRAAISRTGLNTGS